MSETQTLEKNISDSVRSSLTRPFGYSAVGDDDGAPLFDDDSLGDVAGSSEFDLAERRAAAAELLWRIEAEIFHKTEQSNP